MRNDPVHMYLEYVSNTFDRAQLFQQLADEFKVTSAIYPGSYIHITPSLYFPKTTYVDSDRRFLPFFKDTRIYSYIEKNKKYSSKSEIAYYRRDYKELVDEECNVYDLLISQYAGPVSAACKAYLKEGGLLAVNNSHGDASLAYLDTDFTLVAAVHSRDGKYRISDKNLDQYFIPKKDILHTREHIEQLGRGIAYMKTANVYLFQKNARSSEVGIL